MTPTETVLAKLSDPKKTGQGWSARCPAHDDRKASLSISEGDDGRALLKCHAGCDISAVLSALGLTFADLFTPKASPTPGRDNKTAPKGLPFATAEQAIAELERTHGKPSAPWTYYDAQGHPVGMVIRWEKPGGKEIRPLSRHSDGWRICAMLNPRPLYGLPDLANAQSVIVT
jgi:hypothetical protein